MRSILYSLILICIAASGSRGLTQGTVAFNNSSTSLVWMQSWSSGEPATVVPKGGGYVQLAYAPAVSAYAPWGGQGAQAWLSANPGWTLGPITAIGPVAGRFAGGIVTLTGVGAGAEAAYAILAWTGTETTFDAALMNGDYVSISSRFITPTGGVDPLVPPPSISSTFPGMIILGEIPEPSVVSLGILGAAIFFLRGRRTRLP